jgi:hypothetical protein
MACGKVTFRAIWRSLLARPFRNHTGGLLLFARLDSEVLIIVVVIILRFFHIHIVIFFPGCVHIGVIVILLWNFGSFSFRAG